MKRTFVLIGIILLVLVFSCQKEDETPIPETPKLVLPATPYDYSELNFPPHFETTVMNFILGGNLSNNPITDEGATLGRVLFYDKKLSINDEVACASCHFQENGFSDPLAFSVGFDGRTTRRNSMGLANALHTRRFFWDLRANNLRQQVLQPIEDSLEMGSNFEDLVIELSETDYYPDLFEAAFESDTITKEKIGNALTQFINSMTAFSSKYDEGLSSDFENFTPQELLGKELFFERGLKCNQCHTNAVFANTSPSNNGLIHDENDLGFMEVTGNEEDKFRFKAPTLRNISLTAPFMHDGRFATLEEVIEHYNSGLQAYPNLDDRLTTDNSVGGPPRQMNLTEEEKAALVVFLGTFTDEILVTDQKYSDPFE